MHITFVLVAAIASTIAADNAWKIERIGGDDTLVFRSNEGDPITPEAFAVCLTEGEAPVMGVAVDFMPIFPILDDPSWQGFSPVYFPHRDDGSSDVSGFSLLRAMPTEPSTRWTIYGSSSQFLDGLKGDEGKMIMALKSADDENFGVEIPLGGTFWSGISYIRSKCR